MAHLRKCDSCGEERDLLLPVWVLEETTCGLLMAKKLYCSKCWWERMHTSDQGKAE